VADRLFADPQPARVMKLRAVRRRSCSTHGSVRSGIFASNSALRWLNELNGPSPTGAADP
jgi:hypothetical protein